MSLPSSCSESYVSHTSERWGEGLFRGAVADTHQGAFEGFLGKGFDKPLDQPAEAKRDRPAEADRLALDNHSSVLFLESPIRIQTPEIAAVVADGHFSLLARAGVLHFSDLRCETAAGFLAGAM